METRADREDQEASRSDPSLNDVIEAVKNLASDNARAPLDTEEQMWLYLCSWWSRTYNRPLKDPLLKEYSLEELLYEFYDRIEREKAAEELAEQQTDKIEEAKDQAAIDWAEQEEKRELEEEARREQGLPPLEDPTKDPANVKWMEEQVAKQKELLGEDFGEDFNFSEDE